MEYVYKLCTSKINAFTSGTVASKSVQQFRHVCGLTINEKKKEEEKNRGNVCVKLILIRKVLLTDHTTGCEGSCTILLCPGGVAL